MNNSIYIRRLGKIHLDKEQSSLPNDYVLNLLKNTESLGYTFSSELLDRIQTLSVSGFKTFYHQLIADLKQNLGADVQFEPMYPNFPEQVKQASEEELYVNAYFHYVGDWIGRRILPHYQKTPREPLQDKVELKIIDLGSEEEFKSIFTQLLSAKTSVSETDKKDIVWFIEQYRSEVFEFIPTEIPLKENAAIFIASLLMHGLETDAQIRSHIKTATDVLRVAVALSNGDVSLAQNTKFIQLSRPLRRWLLGVLENLEAITEDMLRYKNRWKRLSEVLHPFEYKKRYPKCFEAFSVIRNELPFETFNGKVEKDLNQQNIKTVIPLLKKRPGYFARRLDHLVRLSQDIQYLLEEFSQVAAQVSTPVLLQVKTHFTHRNEPRGLRVFFPKGEVAKVKAIPNELPPLDPGVCAAIVAICDEVLVEKFKNNPPLGKVYLDPKLKNYTVPFSQRSASKALVTIPRGSKIDLPPGKILRFFLYWQEGDLRTDIDLSALALDADSGQKLTVAYYNLKEKGIYHSGDITSAPEGASEFIDIDISQCKSQGIRYLMMSVNSFTQQAYSDLPQCFAGWMVRKYPNSGEIYDPLTVKNKFDLTANAKVSIPLIVDLEEHTVIWTDLSLKNNPSASNNVHHNLSSMSLINKAMTTMVKPNLYDLLTLHIQARGENTLDSKEADLIFAVDKGIKPTDIDILISAYL